MRRREFLKAAAAFAAACVLPPLKQVGAEGVFEYRISYTAGEDIARLIREYPRHAFNDLRARIRPGICVQCQVPNEQCDNMFHNKVALTSSFDHESIRTLFSS